MTSESAAWATGRSGLPIRYSRAMMRRITRYLGLLAIISVAAGCANRATRPDIPPPGFQSGEAEAAWHAFIGELAFQRDQTETAALEYLRAAQLSEDAGVAERAARIAYLGEAWAVAETAARLWSERAPQSADAQRMLTSLAVRNGRPGDALPHLEFLLADGPDDRQNAWLILMLLLSEESDQQAALQAFTLLVGAHEDEAEAHYALAALALEAGDTAAALAAASRGTDLAPDWSRAGLMLARVLVADGQQEAGISTARAVVERDRDADVRLEFAGLLADSGLIDEARSELLEILAEHPDMPDALLAAGLLEMRAEQPEAARMHFTNLLGTGRRNLDALYYLAMVAEREGESTNALQLYLRIRTGRYFPAAQVQVGRLLFQLGQQEAGIEHLRNFARRFPRYAESAVLAEAELLVELGEEEEALLLFDEELEKDPQARGIRYARALLYERTDRVDDALADLFELVDTDPEDANALNALGYTLADRTDRYAEALTYISAALEKLPDQAPVLDSMGWVNYRLGNLQEALDYLERAWSILKDAEVGAHYGEVLWMTGERERAIEIWNSARGRSGDERKLDETMRRFLGED